MQSTDAADGKEPWAVLRPRADLDREIAQHLAFTPREVATRLSVSERYVRTLIEQGELPSVNLGSGKRVLVDDLLAFIERLKTERDAARAIA